jgi:hypothetical protein
MKDRPISDFQLEVLLDALPKHFPDFGKHLDDHHYLMGIDKDKPIEREVAVLDYIRHHLRPREEGYALCFLTQIPAGERCVPITTGDPCNEKGCPKSYELFKLQVPSLDEQISQHQWYMGEAVHHPVTEEEAKQDFQGSKDFLEFFSGFRRCYEERVCPVRANCVSADSRIEKVV